MLDKMSQVQFERWEEEDMKKEEEVWMDGCLLGILMFLSGEQAQAEGAALQ
jgi:hypothetical protein